MNEIIIIGGKSFEELKQASSYGAEFWSARDLMGVLGYTNWRGFDNVIIKAMKSCQESDNIVENHFERSLKMVDIGSRSTRPVSDYNLSRFACYLIAQNGDPNKSEIATAQKYFAIQARRQEVSDQLAADKERLELRNQTKEEFKALSEAAQTAGVQNNMFGVFHDAGYKGLYGGMGLKELKQKKGVKDNVMDYMDTTELAANQFRMTQAKEKLKRDGIKNQQLAIQAHKQVGAEVRKAIEKIGGTMPENIPAAEHIKQVEKRIEGSRPKFLLDEKDAKGLKADEI